MAARKALTAAVLVATTAAQLLASPYLRSQNKDYAGSSPIAAYLAHGDGHDSQSHLNGHREHAHGASQFKAGNFTVVPQSNETCATYGEDQWTGTIDVTDERRLFYWFFDSRNDPENDPVVIWLNGGPGGSSMMGLFIELGPCWLEKDTNVTIPNDFAWNNNASLLFIDQPAGTGFSSVSKGAPLPKADLDGAQDFQMFLNIFFNEAFPSKAHLPIHLAAESYGGHYAPTYVNHIIKSRAYDSRSAFRGNIESIILVNAVIDFTAPSVGAYELLCSDFRGGDIVNATACEHIKKTVPECEALGRSCALSYDPYECYAMGAYCGANIDFWYWQEVEKGLRNPFNINLGCKDFPLCLDDDRRGNFQAFLNQPSVLKALGFPEDYVYEGINLDINTAYTENMTPWKPTTHEIGTILDAYENPALHSDIRMLVLNGNEDFVCNTPGNIWAYDNLLWGGQPEYRITKWESLPEEVAATGFWKGTQDGRLVFVAVDKAGHTVPGDVRQGSGQILQKWLNRGWVSQDRSEA